MEKIQNKVFASAKEGTLFVANQIKNLIEEKASKGEQAILGLVTGASPIYLYKELVKMHNQGLSFSNVVTFNLDEYYPMDPKAIQSYHRFMEEHFFDKVDQIENNRDDYYEKRIKKLKSVNWRSKLNYFSFHLSNPIVTSFRNFILKILVKNNKFLDNYLGKIYRD